MIGMLRCRFFDHASTRKHCCCRDDLSCLNICNVLCTVLSTGAGTLCYNLDAMSTMHLILLAACGMSVVRKLAARIYCEASAEL
jgi:hypothetical protein